MASKVYVSPGVYTSERELSFISQSIGVTTLGLAGETLKGPAFEPIFLTSYDDFQTYFGGLSVEKFVNTQLPKYELPFIAKQYLQQSNQLFVTRVLGLSGYDAGPSWTISTVANPDYSTLKVWPPTQGNFRLFTFSGNTGGTVNYYLTGEDTFNHNQINTFSGSPFYSKFDKVYTKFDGGTSTIRQDITALLTSIFLDNSLSATTTGVYGSVSASTPSTDIFSTLTNYTNHYDVPNLLLTGWTNTDRLNDAWYYAGFDIKNDGTYSGVSGYWTIRTCTNPSDPYCFRSSGIGSFTGMCTFNHIFFSGNSYTDYNDLVVATLRSRGKTQYTSTLHGPQYQVTADTASFIGTGAYSGVTQNPFSTFVISGSDKSNNVFSFETSLDINNANYISKVFGTSNFEKDSVQVPLFVEERYQNLLTYGYNKGYIRGLNTDFQYLPESRNKNQESIGYYLQQYQSPESPWVVSELRGNLVYQLFKIISIPDGNSANRQVKVSIANISFQYGTFDLLVRDYYDTDANPVIIEKFTKMSMDSSQSNYIAKRIGTSDSEYTIQSKYIMVEVNPDAPFNALPCGFEGYRTRTYSTLTSPYVIYKSKYDTYGEEIFNPPFGSTQGDDTVFSQGDNVRRTYLGISDTIGYDSDFYDYKGAYNDPSYNWCSEVTPTKWQKITKGYHMDINASAVTIANEYSNSGDPKFVCGNASFNSEPEDSSSPYYNLFSRKFTFLVNGGFDGWDIYNERRTNSDSYILGASGYRSGQLAGCTRYPTSTGWGAFRPITYNDNTTDYGNTDYYAYLIGVQTFANPEVTNINVFATPGIDYVNNQQLIVQTIDMIENDRADSVYVVTTPDFDILQPSSSLDNLIYPRDAVSNLENSAIDSNYTTTYYPWVLMRDTSNGSQIYLPPTAEVCRNIALTDNIAFPWFATAGYTRGLVDAVRARKKLTLTDRDVLYTGRINPIATYNDSGPIIWGNKTLQVNASSLDRLNVRRLLLQARKLISAVAVRLLFEQNDSVVRQQFLDAVNPILDSIRRDRGLYDFRVVVQNTTEDLDRNQLVGKIYLKPVKSLEFIDIEFLITPTGASFDNI